MKAVFFFAVAAGFAVGGMVAPAQAQTSYTCRDDAGNTYTLSRPCPPSMRTSSVSAGPARSAQYSSGSTTTVRLASEEADHFQYMSERCRSLNNAMRNTRNAAPDVMEGMRREYQRDCREEESAASMRLSKERSAARRQAESDEKQAQTAQAQDQDRKARETQQCAESRRIIDAKKKRTDLSEGERADLRRFEDNVRARCP